MQLKFLKFIFPVICLPLKGDNKSLKATAVPFPFTLERMNFDALCAKQQIFKEPVNKYLSSGYLNKIYFPFLILNNNKFLILLSPIIN